MSEKTKFVNDMLAYTNTRPFNYLGLPIGLQISGRPFAEAAVLQAADAYQRDTDWHARRPAGDSSRLNNQTRQRREG